MHSNTSTSSVSTTTHSSYSSRKPRRTAALKALNPDPSSSSSNTTTTTQTSRKTIQTRSYSPSSSSSNNNNNNNNNNTTIEPYPNANASLFNSSAYKEHLLTSASSSSSSLNSSTSSLSSSLSSSSSSASDTFDPSSDAFASHPYDLCSICWRGEYDRPESAFRDWVECDLCRGWCHAVCLHTPFAELTKLSKFRCPTCVVEKGSECTSEHYGKGVQTFVKSINERMKIIYKVYKEFSRIHIHEYSQRLLQQVIATPHPEYTPSNLCKPTFSQCFMPGFLIPLDSSHISPKRKRRH